MCSGVDGLAYWGRAYSPSTVPPVTISTLPSNSVVIISSHESGPSRRKAECRRCVNLASNGYAQMPALVLTDLATFLAHNPAAFILG